ncbi:MAG: hypothetical protein ACTSQO_08105 [Candidatus Helarchaeota archaeon]
MELKLGKCLLFGSINLVIYLVAPSIIIFMMSYYKILQFSPTFVISLMIMGLIQSGISYFKNLFPSESLIFNLIGIGTSIYSGIYFFYMFGGFSLDRTFGYYQVKTSNLEASFGLQFFAWLIFIASLINTTYYIIKGIESSKKKVFFVGKKIKLRNIALISIIFIYLIIGAFIASIIISGTRLSFNLKDEYTYTWDTGSNPFSHDDDRIQIITYFDVPNLGIYSVKKIHLNIDIYTVNTTDTTQLLLPDNTKIGEIKDVYYPEFPAMQVIYNQNLTIDIIPQYVPGLITNNATLRLFCSLQCSYAGIIIDLNTTIHTIWTALA